jgi:hypothetical protein
MGFSFYLYVQTLWNSLSLFVYLKTCTCHLILLLICFPIYLQIRFYFIIVFPPFWFSIKNPISSAAGLLMSVSIRVQDRAP